MPHYGANRICSATWSNFAQFEHDSGSADYGDRPVCVVKSLTHPHRAVLGDAVDQALPPGIAFNASMHDLGRLRGLI